MNTQPLKKFFDLILIAFAIFFSPASNAQIVYTDVNPDQTLNTNGATYDLDLNNDNTNDFEFTVIIGASNCVYTQKHYAYVEVFPVNGNKTANDSFYYESYPRALDTLNEISSSLTPWSNGGRLRYVSTGDFCNFSYGNWVTSADRYLGVKLMSGGNTYYGWARLSVNVLWGIFANLTVMDYAYNSIPDSSILADDSGFPLGMQANQTENKFSIFPNPASDKINLSFSSSEKKQIQITNTLGQIVFTEEINSVKKEIDVCEFPAGMYVVSAQTSVQKVEKVFLKQ